MSDFDAKKYSAAEVALLLIFAAGLLIAWGMVRSRSDITLTVKEPPASGVKVSLPQGGGWESDTQWRFARNAYYMTSQQGSEQEGSTKVTVGYMISAAAPAQALLEQRANQLGGQVVKTKDVSGKNAVMTLGELGFAEHGPTVICGAATLGAGRSVSIELIDNGAGSSEWLWSLAEKLAASVAYGKNGMLEEGAKIVGGVKGNGLEGWFKQQSRENYFLIARQQNEPAGFLINLNSKLQTDSAMNLRLVSALYLQDVGGQENVFQTDGQLGRWVWVSSGLASSGGRGGRVEAYLNEKGQLSVRRFGRILEFSNPGPAAIPEAVLEAAFLQMAAVNVRTVLVDVINADGSIVPSTISIEKGKNGDVAYVAKIEYLDGSGKVQNLTFNKKFHVVSGELGPKPKLQIRGSNKDEVLKNFAVWADYIESLDGLLKGNTADKSDSKEVYL